MKKNKNPQKKSSFAPAFLFLNKEQQAALKSVYAFCRIIDDIVDENTDNPTEKLAFWTDEIERLYLGNPTAEITKNILPFVKKFNLKKEHFLLIVEGVTQDLSINRYKTFEDLEFYLYRVAGAVGFLCINIFGAKNTKTYEYAEYLGHGVQLTNIIRDIEKDAALNRIYIPSDDMDKFGVLEQEILTPHPNAKITAMLNFEYKRALKYYKLAEKILPKEDYKNMLPARIMASLYKGLLQKIKRNNFSVFDKEIKLSALEKLTAVIKAVL